MDKELLQATYDQIQLNEEQEARILAKLEQEQKKSSANRMKSWAQRAAVIVASVLVLSSATVYAAKEFGIAERMKQIYIDNGEYDIAYTQEEKAMYEKLGTILNKEYKLKNGTISLDAVIYDSNILIVPFTYRKEEDKTLSVSTLFEEEHSGIYIDENGGGMAINYAGSDMIRGYYYADTYDGNFIKKGDKVTFMVEEWYNITENNGISHSMICDSREIDSFKLTKDITGLTKKIIDVNYELNSGMVLTDVTVTPLSLSITTNYEEGKYYEYNSVNWERVKLIKKDDSVVEESETFGSRCTMNNDETVATLLMPFENPINLEELDYIQIELADETFKIPIN